MPRAGETGGLVSRRVLRDLRHGNRTDSLVRSAAGPAYSRRAGSLLGGDSGERSCGRTRHSSSDLLRLPRRRVIPREVPRPRTRRPVAQAGPSRDSLTRADRVTVAVSPRIWHRGEAISRLRATLL